MLDEQPLPAHGRMRCTACFPGSAEWGRTTIPALDGWTLENNPCAWGSRNPRFLILGFSKGERQSRGILSKRHDEIPYAGFRPRLTKRLQTLGLLAEGETICEHIGQHEPDWAFGSLVRCSLAENGRKSGTIISSAATARSYLEWRDRCTNLYLSKLPSRLQIVIMLSNDDRYIEICRDRIAKLHPGTQPINDVSYGDDRVTWVHTIHFGGQGFNHMNDWNSLAANTAGRKGRSAVAAVRRALSRG